MKRTFSKSDWKDVEGASVKPKRLKLEPDGDGLYVCPVENCDSNSYKSQRGCRKHVYVKHGWFYYFNKKPDVQEAFPQKLVLPAKRQAARNRTWDIPSFSEKCQLAKDFVSWICSAGGGGKDLNQAEQICKKILKFCKFCCKNLDDDYEVTRHVVEYCVGSVELIQKFMTYLEEQCKLGNSGIISYLQSLSHCLDFLRFKGLRANEISTLITTEVFLSRAKQCLRKKLRVEWNTVLSIEHLEDINCWASLGELQKVLLFHENRFEQVINLAKGNAVIPHDLTFATSFLVTVLFLKVKGSRPMTYQFLTIEMMRSAFNNGVIDQTHFKTEEKYGFDSLIFTDYVLQKVRSYIDFVRPKLKPACNFLLICKNGSQLANLGDVFGRMVYQAIGKYVNPTRYRQIIETASSDFLSIKDQSLISLDQKHTSNVAKVHYQKKRSREVAQKAINCMEKLIQGSQNENRNSLEISGNESEEGETQEINASQEEVEEVQASVIEPPSTRKSVRKKCKLHYGDETEPNEDAVANSKNERRKKNLFTKEEDHFLLKGLKRYGKGKWTHILKDPEYKFHPSRKNSTLMMRAKAKCYT